MIDRHHVEALRATLAGEVILPADAAYEECRKVFNAMHDKRPAVIARCRSTADVVAAVDFARENGLLVAVRSGGHSVAGLSICADGILIDLSGLKKIDIDVTARTARAGGGVLWGEFDAATQQHGLHTPGGRVTTTGVGGFTTGGGYGWTSSKYGLTCDNLLSAEVVLADGRVVKASEHENADLFWGIRGGSGNFGIVTEFEYRLHPLGPIVLAGLALWPIERAPEVVRAWRDYVDGAPDELSTACVVIDRSARAVRSRGHARASRARRGGHVRRRRGRGREGHAAAQGPSTRGRSHPADAIHGVPGDDRSDGPKGVSQLLAGRYSRACRTGRSTRSSSMRRR